MTTKFCSLYHFIFFNVSISDVSRLISSFLRLSSALAVRYNVPMFRFNCWFSSDNSWSMWLEGVLFGQGGCCCCSSCHLEFLATEGGGGGGGSVVADKSPYRSSSASMSIGWWLITDRIIPHFSHIHQLYNITQYSYYYNYYMAVVISCASPIWMCWVNGTTTIRQSSSARPDLWRRHLQMIFSTQFHSIPPLIHG